MLTYAARYGRVDSVRLLLDAGADMNAKDKVRGRLVVPVAAHILVWKHCDCVFVGLYHLCIDFLRFITSWSCYLTSFWLKELISARDFLYYGFCGISNLSEWPLAFYFAFCGVNSCVRVL